MGLLDQEDHHLMYSVVLEVHLQEIGAQEALLLQVCFLVAHQEDHLDQEDHHPLIGGDPIQTFV